MSAEAKGRRARAISVRCDSTAIRRPVTEARRELSRDPRIREPTWSCLKMIIGPSAGPGGVCVQCGVVYALGLAARAIVPRRSSYYVLVCMSHMSCHATHVTNRIELSGTGPDRVALRDGHMCHAHGVHTAQRRRARPAPATPTQHTRHAHIKSLRPRTPTSVRGYSLSAAGAAGAPPACREVGRARVLGQAQQWASRVPSSESTMSAAEALSARAMQA